jgi:hypothetical protein
MGNRTVHTQSALLHAEASNRVYPRAQARQLRERVSHGKREYCDVGL